MKLNINRRFLFFVFCLILLFISVGMTRGERGQIMGPESWVKTGVAWLQSYLSYPIQHWGFQDQKSEMTRSTNELARMEAEIHRLKKENEQMKRLLGYTEKVEIRRIPARVVYRSPDRFYQRVVINRGAKDGVQSNMPIITDEGLIGRVQSVTDHMADVQLLIHSGSGPGISAVIQGEKEETLGIIEGYDSIKRCLVMRKIPVTAKIKKGQVVTTSHLSEIYPGGIYIGTVLDVTPGENGIEQKVLIQPGASFEQLDMVIVLQDAEKMRLNQHLSENKGGKEDE